METALSLGSDCPFFLDGNPAFAEGRGELLDPVKLLPEGFRLVIINPGIHINTGEAFSHCKPKHSESILRELYDLDISKWKDQIINDFEEPIFRKHPEIAEIKELLYKTGALYSSMSGSGSSVYGIFRSEPLIPQSLRQGVVYSGPL
jgi:4-diphosphocytidyl-2-C-methyl-D-erythritol kinase